MGSDYEIMPSTTWESDGLFCQKLENLEILLLGPLVVSKPFRASRKVAKGGDHGGDPAYHTLDGSAPPTAPRTPSYFLP